jgi:RNA polymerase sigma-70 factor (ECF subfamily)
MDNSDNQQNMESVDDASLIQRCVEQNHTPSFGVLFNRYSDMAYRTALRIMRNTNDAEDIVQIAFMKIIRDLPKYRGGAGVRSWITKYIVNCCMDKIREEKRRNKRENRHGKPEHIIDWCQWNKRTCKKNTGICGYLAGAVSITLVASLS